MRPNPSQTIQVAFLALLWTKTGKAGENRLLKRDLARPVSIWSRKTVLIFPIVHGYDSAHRRDAK